MIESLFNKLSSPSWIPFWTTVEAISIVAVGVGCAGEWAITRYRRSIVPKDDPMTVYRFKEKWDGRFSALVAIGIAVELVAFIFSYTASSKEIEGLKRDNLELQRVVQWRTITSEQEADLISVLSSVAHSIRAPHKGVVICVEGENPETKKYAFRIGDVLLKCGFDAHWDGVLHVGSREGEGVLLEIRSKANAPPHADAIFNAFQKVKIAPLQAKENTNAMPDEVTVWVLAKPEK